MSAHRARHSSASGGLRPVSEILAQVAAGPGGGAALSSQRSAFTMAAAAAVGAGTAAASMTGAFPAIQAPSFAGFNDTQSFAKVVEPAALSAHTPAALAANAPHAATASHPAAAAGAVAPASSSAGSVSSVGSGAPAGTVMASNLHQTDAMQIAALSRSVDMNRAAAVPAAAPAAVPNPAKAVTDTVQQAAATAGSLVNAALSLPSHIGGVPISGTASSKTAALALRSAATKLGVPYVWGAVGPKSFDCSGLMLWAYKQAGVSLPRTSSAQSKAGVPVSKGDLKPGDMVFFYSPVSHVGMYIGNGKVLHASEPGEPVKISNLSAFPFHNARRVT